MVSSRINQIKSFGFLPQVLKKYTMKICKPHRILPPHIPNFPLTDKLYIIAVNSKIIAH